MLQPCSGPLRSGAHLKHGVTQRMAACVTSTKIHPDAGSQELMLHKG